MACADARWNGGLCRSRTVTSISRGSRGFTAADRVVGSAEERVRGLALLGDAGDAGILTLIGLAVGQVVVVGDLHRRSNCQMLWIAA